MFLMTQFLEDVPYVESEDSDGSAHSHIFPTAKAPPSTLSTPARKKKKISAKKPFSRIVSSTAKIFVPDDLTELFMAIDQEEITPASP